MMMIIKSNNNNNQNYNLGGDYNSIQLHSVEFFNIYVPNQQPRGQLQTQHIVDTSNYIMDKHNIKSETNYGQALEEKQ
jgi:hypothetical protein